jgi:hypothetical protein
MAEDTSAPAGVGIAARRSATVACWLCGASLHKNQLMPDGGSACADVRWYCKDVQACTRRWNMHGRRMESAGVA